MAAREWSAMRAGDDTDWVVVDDTEYDPDVVCTVHQTNEHSSFTTEDNAWLIAAAPDLLAALESVMHHMEIIGYNHESARAAIAKAKGREPWRNHLKASFRAIGSKGHRKSSEPTKPLSITTPIAKPTTN